MIKNPINFSFVASGIGIRGKGELYKLESAARKQEPSWKERNEEKKFETGLQLPITDLNYWESGKNKQNRYALTTLELKNAKGEKLFMQEVVMSISQQKQITTTSINGLEGTIKEYISNGDYQIDIATAVVATDNANNIIDEYPADAVGKLQKFLNQHEALAAVSPLLKMFDITRLVVTQYAIACDASSNRQGLSIKAISDKDYTIRQEEY